MSRIQEAIQKAEGYLALELFEEAWNILEDLPSESKGHPRVLELQLQCFTLAKLWEKVEILADSLTHVFPGRFPIWLALARAQCQQGKLVAAAYSVSQASLADPDKRLEMLDDPLLAALYA